MTETKEQSHSIKVKDTNYFWIQEHIRSRENYDDVVTRLISTYEKAWELLSAIEGSIKFREVQIARLGETTIK